MRKILRVLVVFFIVFGSLLAILAYNYYGKVFSSNVEVKNGKEYLYISKDANFENVIDSLKVNGFIKNIDEFIWVAKLKNYHKKVKGGKYLLKDGMTNNSLVNMLRSGKQVPVKVTFNNIRTKEDLAKKISKQIEASYDEILGLLNNKDFITELGFKKETVLCLFLPNTYEFYWSTDAKQFILRMNDEYKKFWNETRTKKAKEVNLTPIEVSILASIVQAEQGRFNDEKPTIAGLYINRLTQGIALQSDPTLVYAAGDFSIKRVLNVHKEINSPYNTYMYAGLTPGPINLPEISSIDAVLNYEKHDYLFMCAKDDFSGYHYFAKTASQHNVYAQRYHAALNGQKIYK